MKEKVTSRTRVIHQAMRDMCRISVAKPYGKGSPTAPT